MNVTSDVARIPGWYGKLPSLGDFASRRLEADFIEPWDLWLGEGLQAQRSTFGEGWLDAYLDTPAWRFLLSPGALGGVHPELAFAGVLVPSVDRVGRHFPLTLVASLSRLPDLAAEFDALLAWLHRLEDTALDALHGDWTIDDLENALADLSPPGADGNAAVEDRLTTVRRALADAVARRGGFVDIAGISSRADLAAFFSAPPGTPTPRPPMRGLAIWIADTPGRPQLLVSEGLAEPG
jgi:type VI secretion system protein ImpM